MTHKVDLHDLMTTTEAAKALGMSGSSRTAIWRLHEGGLVPGIVLTNGNLVVDGKAVRALAADRQAQIVIKEALSDG